MTTVPALLLTAVIILGVIITLAVIRQRSRGENPEVRSTLLLTVARFFAILFAGLMSIATVVNSVGMLVNDTVSVSLPVEQFWPEAYPWITFDPAPQASVVGGGFTTADVLVNGLGMDARWALAAGGAVQGLIFVAIASVIALLCHRLLGGTPFRPLLASSTMWVAAAIAAGGIAWQILFEIGGRLASRQVLQVSGWSSYLPDPGFPDYINANFDPLATGLPGPSQGFNVDVSSLLWGLALATVAIAFRYGERLQKDTTGLI